MSSVHPGESLSLLFFGSGRCCAAPGVIFYLWLQPVPYRTFSWGPRLGLWCLSWFYRSSFFRIKRRIPFFFSLRAQHGILFCSSLRALRRILACLSLRAQRGNLIGWIFWSTFFLRDCHVTSFLAMTWTWDCHVTSFLAMTFLPYCHYKKSCLISEHKHHSLLLRLLIKKAVFREKVSLGAWLEPSRRITNEGF